MHHDEIHNTLFNPLTTINEEPEKTAMANFYRYEVNPPILDLVQYRGFSYG